jgi:hypothetical protein
VVYPYPPAVLELLFQNADNLVARRGHIVIQVRSGALGVEAMEAVVQGLQLVRAEKLAKPAAIAVLEDGAPMPDRAMRARQKELVPRHAAPQDLRMAVAILGEGAGASLLRTVARTLTLTPDRVKVTGSVEHACRWLAPHVGVNALELRAWVDDARERLRASR